MAAESLQPEPVIEDEGWNGYQHFTDPTRLPFNVLTYPSHNCSVPSFDKIVPDLGKKLLGQDWTENIGIFGNKEKFTTMGGAEVEVRVAPSELSLEVNNQVGTFTIGETITGGNTKATGVIVSKNVIDITKNELILKEIFGTFQVGETITGATSHATAVITANNTTRGDMIQVLYTDLNPLGEFYNTPHWYTISQLDDNPLPKGLHRYSFDQWFDTNLNPAKSLNVPRLVWVNGLPQVFSWIGAIAPIVNVTGNLASVDTGTLALNTINQVLSSYSETHQDANTALFAGSVIGLGQSFQNPVAAILSSCKFYLKKVGTPTGNITAKVYASTGSLGSTSKPTGAALATSDAITSASLTTSYVLRELTFSGVNKISLAAGTNYVVVVTYNGGDGSNNVVVGVDTSAPTHAGNQSFSGDLSTWTATAGTDVCFYIYGTISGPTGPFTAAETITGGLSGATAVVAQGSDTFSPLTIVKINGEFQAGETVTGSTSGAHGVVTSYIAPTITWASLGFIDPSISGYAGDADFRVNDFVYAIASGWGTSTVTFAPTLPEIVAGDLAFSIIRADDAPIPFDFCRQTKNYMYYGNWKKRQQYQSNAFNRDASATIIDTNALLDDMGVSGDYTAAVSHRIKVLITGTGTPDHFQWQVDDAPPTTGVAITGAAQLLNYGISVTFGATTGHSVGDYWEIDLSPGVSDAWFNFFYSLPIRKPGEGYIFRLPSNFWTMDVQEDKLYVNSTYGEWGVVDTVLSADLQSESVIYTPLKQSGSLKVIDPWMTGHIEDDLIFITLDKSLMAMGRKPFLQEPQNGYLSDPVKYDFLPCSFTGGSIKYIQKKLFISSPEQAIMHCFDNAKKYWQPPKTFSEVGILSVVGNDLIAHSNIRNQTFTMFADPSDNGQPYEVLARTPFTPYFKLVGRKRIPARWDSKFSSNSFIEGYISGNPELYFTAFLSPNDSVGVSHVVTPVIAPGAADRASIGEGVLGSHPLGSDLAQVGMYFNEIYRKFKPILSYYFVALQIGCISKNHSYSILSLGLNMSFSPTGNNTLIGDREVL